MSVGNTYTINISSCSIVGARAFGPGAHATGSVIVSSRNNPVSHGRFCEGNGQAPIPSRVAYFHEGKEISLEESDRLYSEDGIWTEPKVVKDPTSNSYSCPFCQAHMSKKDLPTMHPHMRDYSIVLR